MARTASKIYFENPSEEEAHCLIRIKRKAAKASLAEIIECYATDDSSPDPSVELLIEYLSNMVYALELLLKLLSGNWDNHNVSEMYERIFSRNHSDSDLLSILERSIKNQKFLFRPANNLFDKIPEMEFLWNELNKEFCMRNRTKIIRHEFEYIAPERVRDFLKNHIGSFIKPTTFSSSGALTKRQKLRKLDSQITHLENERRVLAENGDPLDEPKIRDGCELAAELLRIHQLKIESGKKNFDKNLGLRNGEMRFGKLSLGVVNSDFLG